MQNTEVTYPLFRDKKERSVETPVPLAPLADTHGHLTSLRRFEPAKAIARAALAGVRLLVVPVDPADDVADVPGFQSWFARSVEQAAQLLDAAAREGMCPPEFDGHAHAPALVDNVHFVAGVHPYGAQRYNEDRAVRARLETLLKDPRCVGVGEFGMDFGPWNKVAADAQEKAFRSQLRIAHEQGLPVELHLRDGEADTRAHDIALRVLCEEGVPAAGCDLHCFTSGPDVLAPFVEMGCYAAFGGAATFARSEGIRAAAIACPKELLLCETDSPYMTPVPLRGQECEPAMVAFSVECVAKERASAGVACLCETYDALWANANRLFDMG